MKQYLSILVISSLLFIGCGSDGSTPSKNNGLTSTQHNSIPNIFFNDPIVNKVKEFNVATLPAKLNNISKDNYIEVYKRVQQIQLSGFPKLGDTFSLNARHTNSSKALQKNNKVVYENRWSREDEYNCIESGSVTKEVRLIPRENFDADTYKVGDNTDFSYSNCDMRNVRYNGKVTYHVNDFKKFDYTFGAIPLGEFTSNFNHMSRETETQKITLDGTIKFNSSARYKPKPDGSLTWLEMKYSTVGDFTVTVYDKYTGETTKLTYNGVLEKIDYNHEGSSSSSSTSVNNNSSHFSYRKTSDYRLFIENGTKVATLRMVDNIPGMLNSDGSVAVRAVGGDYIHLNMSELKVGWNQVYQIQLADGTTKYIFDKDADLFPEASEVEGTPKYTLPLSNVGLMQGVVVIGFDACPYTVGLRKNLEELGIEYKYVNTKASQEEHNILNWFGIYSVPYIGIDGAYFAIGGSSKYKSYTAAILSLYGHESDVEAVKRGRQASASIKLKGWFEELQSKPKHTALAVAVDTPYLYQAWWVWGYSSKEKARINALQKCEKARSERVSKGKKPVLSTCKIYSIDGVKQ